MLQPSEPISHFATQKTAETFESLSTLFTEVAESTGKVVQGQSAVIEQTLAAVLAGGHALLVGVPGVAKTKLVKTLGIVLGLDMRRVQFTPDLMPADILGAEVLQTDNDGNRHFSFVSGPVFCNLLMADEINRASPRTQSALLEAMQEQQVTVAGAARPTPQPFHVIATQNPIEQEGTYPLPEAQLDRFLVQIDMGYPDLATERDVILSTTGVLPPDPEAVASVAALQAAQLLIRQMPIPSQVLEAALAIVRAARPGPDQPDIRWGAGPRAAQALVQCAKARAFLRGMPSPVIDDVRVLADPVLKHRLHLSYSAQGSGKSVKSVIHELVERHA
jgi:MoxR-like ATPase